MRFFISQIKQTISRMMRMQSKFGTIFRHAAFGAHPERLSTSIAKFKFTLGAREMHATTPIRVDRLGINYPSRWLLFCCHFTLTENI